MKFSYKKLQDYIKEPLPAVDVLREKIIFHAFEVESVEDLGAGDYELDIKILPDRAHDAKDERGMAREIAALFGLNLVDPDSYDKASVAQIDFSLEKISALLGREISEDDIKTVFDAYHYHYELKPPLSKEVPSLRGGGVGVTLFVPPWRTDLKHIYDIADEIGRYVGYETISAVLPNLPKVTKHDDEFEYIVAKKFEMISQGYHEVMTYSLTKKGDYQVAKGPKGKDFLRTNLLDGLRAAYVVNKNNEELLPNQSSKIFEIGKVFPKSGEELHVAWIDAKGEHEEILTTHQSSETLEQHLRPTGTSSERGGHFTMWSEYPFMTRDVAVWVPEGTTPEAVSSIIAAQAGGLAVKPPRLFDQFTKDGRTSFGFRLVFQAMDKTLTDEELAPVMDNVYASLKEQGWEIR
jgi:phenylalanyl-tRNA synthetase beta subunit